MFFFGTKKDLWLAVRNLPFLICVWLNSYIETCIARASLLVYQIILFSLGFRTSLAARPIGSWRVRFGPRGWVDRPCTLQQGDANKLIHLPRRIRSLNLGNRCVSAYNERVLLCPAACILGPHESDLTVFYLWCGWGRPRSSARQGRSVALKRAGGFRWASSGCDD